MVRVLIWAQNGFPPKKVFPNCRHLLRFPQDQNAAKCGACCMYPHNFGPQFGCLMHFHPKFAKFLRQMSLLPTTNFSQLVRKAKTPNQNTQTLNQTYPKCWRQRHLPRSEKNSRIWAPGAFNPLNFCWVKMRWPDAVPPPTEIMVPHVFTPHFQKMGHLFDISPIAQNRRHMHIPPFWGENQRHFGAECLPPTCQIEAPIVFTPQRFVKNLVTYCICQQTIISYKVGLMCFPPHFYGPNLGCLVRSRCPKPKLSKFLGPNACGPGQKLSRFLCQMCSSLPQIFKILAGISWTPNAFTPKK